ncbi:MAG: hypothetical protein KY475_08950 [Planctomycetes bacterium]|nr:hypothetical protein [Planctomycetota bacterium]
MSTTFLTLALALAQAPFGNGPVDADAIRARDEVEQAAREFRGAVYRSFRTDRAEFDRRWIAGEELLRHWTVLDQPVAHQGEVTAWFVEATHAARIGRSELPLLPHLPEPTLPTVIRDDESSSPEESLPPPVAPPAAESAVEDDNPFLPAPPDPAPPQPDDATTDATGNLPGKIHTLLDLSESIFGGSQ